MSAFASHKTNPFALDVAEGLVYELKRIDYRYLFDEVGLALWNALTLSPEFCIARAEERIQRRSSAELSRYTGHTCLSANLDTHQTRSPEEWVRKAMHLANDRSKRQPLMMTLLGNSIGLLNRSSFFHLLQNLHDVLHPGDFFLFNVDFVKDSDKVIAPYDDPAGIVSAFNKNLLARINRELLGRFNLRSFDHVAKWNSLDRCVELHLVAREALQVYIGDLGHRFTFDRGESIRTLRDYKYTENELDDFAERTAFRPVKIWIDIECAFAQILWTV